MTTVVIVFAALLAGLLFCLGYQIAFSRLECAYVRLNAERRALDAEQRGFAVTQQISELRLAAEQAMYMEAMRASHLNPRASRW